MWSHDPWRGTLLPLHSKKNQALHYYSQLFNSVEGNTTFYADQNATTLSRWATQSAADFRFYLKVPRYVTHPLQHDSAHRLSVWLQSLAPLAEKILFIQLQLSAQTGPESLAQIAELVATIVPHFRCAVEVRHLAFFDKGPHEQALHQCLRFYQAERVCFDSRALFAYDALQPYNTVIATAQQKKPRLPVHAVLLQDLAIVRFIGQLEMDINRQFYQPWLHKCLQWFNQGRSVAFYMHTPDNHTSPQLAWHFAKDLAALGGPTHPILERWPLVEFAAPHPPMAVSGTDRRDTNPAFNHQHQRQYQAPSLHSSINSPQSAVVNGADDSADESTDDSANSQLSLL